MTIVIGAAHNLGWSKVQYWWKSLLLTGFDASKIHILHYDRDEFFLQQLRSRSIRNHPCELIHGQVVIDRFKDLAAFAAHQEPREWIVCTDLTDLVFQKHPDGFLDTVRPHLAIVVASEGVRFEDNAWTRRNLLVSFPDQWERMRDKQFYNAGSFAARAGILTSLAEEVYRLCMTNPEAKNHDQAALNILLHTKDYEPFTYFTRVNDPWCFSAASSMFASREDAKGFKDTMPIVRNGKCYVRGNLLTTMFHHYTRDIPTKRSVERWIDRAWDAVRD